MITVQQAGCHDTCLDVVGENHVTNVNPIGDTNPQVWRVDCDTCFTCIRAGITTKREAVEIAKQHVIEKSQEKHGL